MRSRAASVVTSKATLVEFFHIWAKLRGWKVPAFHYRALMWLESRGDLAVWMMFRGAAKSTLLAIYNAWRYYQDPSYRILHQGDQDGTAHKTARDTKAVLMRHPLTAKQFRDVRGEISFWWVPGANDERNPSMQAAGILSNITSSRADEVQNDDVEVPKNIGTVDAREKLRYRLSEQTHILAPGGRALFVGTPHTHDSLYAEQIRMGADALIIRLFGHEHRIETATKADQLVPFKPEFVFEGIGERARLLVEGRDYRLTTAGIRLTKPSGALVDCYAGCAWPERFDGEALAKRRRTCRTINEWDSQYQLHAKPLTQVRLDPDRLVAYDAEPQVRTVNRTTMMVLGNVQIVSARLRMDPSSGKKNSDVSALALILQDALGRLYWHRAIALRGELAEIDDNGVVQGGQVEQICDVIEMFQIGRIEVETNSIGGHVPSILRGAIKRRRLACGVGEDAVRSNKNADILAALEPPLTSGYLWAHVSVIDTIEHQMRDWNPAVTEQPDDYLDCAARAILAEPVRIGKVVGQKGGIPPGPSLQDWRPNGGVHEVELDLS
ncbi:MAG: phage terminase large subunit [Opitutia bacterium]